MVLHLERRGIRPVRFHPQSIGLTSRINVRWESGKSPVWELQIKGWNKPIRGEEIGSIWYRRTFFARHSQLDAEDAAFVEGETREAVMGLFYMTEKAFWVSRPDCQRKAESKPWQLAVAQTLGFRIPRTLITNDPAEFQLFYQSCDGEIIFKTLTQGGIGAQEGRGVYTNRVTPEQARDAGAIHYGPCLFQELIPKALDLRVTVIGENVFPVEIHSQEAAASRVDWRRGNQAGLKHRPHTLPGEVENLCRLLLKRMELRFGAIDLVLTPEGEYVFLEINPSGQFAWMESAAGLKLVEPLAELLIGGCSTQPPTG